MVERKRERVIKEWSVLLCCPSSMQWEGLYTRDKGVPCVRILLATNSHILFIGWLHNVLKQLNNQWTRVSMHSVCGGSLSLLWNNLML